ncbi:MAG: RNA polymerase sigma factor [Gemmataceae bacterium]
MDADSLPSRLSHISTMWSMLDQVRDGQSEAATAACNELMQRYGGPIHRYLIAALRDTHAADDLTQEFALGLVRGAYHNVSPERGRFRSYIKKVLFHLVSRYRRQEKKRGMPLPQDGRALEELASPSHDLALESAFEENWRDELLARTWETLGPAHPRLYAVLRLRAAHPDYSSEQLAELLGKKLGKSIKPETVRQNLHRARTLFAELLLQEVACSLRCPTKQEIEQELSELNLLTYCKLALESRE